MLLHLHFQSQLLIEVSIGDRLSIDYRRSGQIFGPGATQRF